MWTCQICNNQNDDLFCLNCGAHVESQASLELPPTMLGAAVVEPTMQANQFQSQPAPPAQFQSQPNFAVPNSAQTTEQEAISAAPPKKGMGKALMIGGLVLLIPLAAAGLLLYIMVIEPYQSNKKWNEREDLNLARARMLTAKEILPESISYRSQDFKRDRTFDKTQLAQLSRDMPKEVQAEMSSINDAAVATYVNGTNIRLALQVYKYDSFEQAEKTCEKIAQGMIRNKDNFDRTPFLVVDPSRRGNCDVSGELKNGEAVGVHSLYGFLYIDSGHKDYALELGSQVWGKLIR